VQVYFKSSFVMLTQKPLRTATERRGVPVPQDEGPQDKGNFLCRRGGRRDMLVACSHVFLSLCFAQPERAYTFVSAHQL